jgi:hypothetical protein
MFSLSPLHLGRKPLNWAAVKWVEPVWPDQVCAGHIPRQLIPRAASLNAERPIAEQNYLDVLSVKA